MASRHCISVCTAGTCVGMDLDESPFEAVDSRRSSEVLLKLQETQEKKEEHVDINLKACFVDELQGHIKTQQGHLTSS